MPNVKYRYNFKLHIQQTPQGQLGKSVENHETPLYNILVENLNNFVIWSWLQFILIFHSPCLKYQASVLSEMLDTLHLSFD